jgi:hypothetical protein
MSQIEDFLKETDGFQVASFTTGKDGETISTKYVPGRQPYVAPEGMFEKARSVLVDASGKVIQTWYKSSREEEDRWAKMLELLEAAKAAVYRVPEFPYMLPGEEDWLATYPVGDQHMGMLAWKYEVGTSYDLDIAEDVLDCAGDHLTNVQYPARYSLVAFLGDFMHYDSMVPQTPTNRNPLDADGRAAKMVPATWRAMRRLVDQVALKHEFVHVIVESGNHDPMATLWLVELLRTAYENNSRITIDRSPSNFHYYRFGKVLIGTHHGNKVKMKAKNLPLIMATDRAQDWGETTHRTIWTGHIHSLNVQEYQGCTVESFQILAPGDAWSHGMGYRAQRSMKSILFHKDMGEVSRYTFRPEMLK